MKNLQIAALLHDRGLLSAVAVALLGVLLLTLATKPVLHHPPQYDELLHALAAHGVVETGEPVIDEGEYERAELFTRTVAVAYRMRGESLEAARLPARICGLLLVALIGVWVVRKAGLIAGAFTAVLLALTPLTVEMSVFARFYTMHALTIALTVILALEAIAPSRTVMWRAVLGVLALISLAVSKHLQPSTMVAFAGAVPGLFAVWAYDHWSTVRAAVQAHPARWAIVALVIVAAGLLAAWQLEFLDRLSETPLWLTSVAGNRGFYLGALRHDLPLLWPLLPVAIVLALSFQPRLALLCTVFTLVVLGIHSIAAQKALRYVFYALPFLCVLFGLAFAAAVSLIGNWARQVMPRVGEFSALLALLLLGMVYLNSEEGTRSAKLVLGKVPLAEFTFGNEADWDKAARTLKPLLSRARTIIASSGFKALHTLGRYDYELNASVVYETDTQEEFGRDYRTGRRVISTPQSLERVIDTPGDELVVADASKVGMPVHISNDAAKVLDSRCSKVIVPAQSGTRAWLCIE